MRIRSLTILAFLLILLSIDSSDALAQRRRPRGRRRTTPATKLAGPAVKANDEKLDQVLSKLDVISQRQANSTAQLPPPVQGDGWTPNMYPAPQPMPSPSVMPMPANLQSGNLDGSLFSLGSAYVRQGNRHNALWVLERMKLDYPSSRLTRQLEVEIGKK